MKLVPAVTAVQPPVSDWLQRHWHLIQKGGDVLDLACGAGRHSYFLAHQGFPVVALDRDDAGFPALLKAGISTVQFDLETPEALAAWPFAERSLAAIVVFNYLHRPLFPVLLNSLAEGGLLIYETFMQGQAQFGKPSNPAFLLEPGELLTQVTAGSADGMQVIAFEQGCVQTPVPRMVQRICARRARQLTPQDLL